MYAPNNGSSAGGNTPANGSIVTAHHDVSQVEPDFVFKVNAGAYYGHPDPIRGQYVLGEGNPGGTTAYPDAVVAAYKRTFHQHSVGVIVRPACVAF